MSFVQICFNGVEKKFKKGIVLIDFLKKQGVFNEDILIGKLNNLFVDLSCSIEEDAVVEVLNFDDEEGKKALWHSAAHVMAQAVKRLYGDVQYAAGPVVQDGFYYDMQLSKRLSEKDFALIEQNMHSIVKNCYDFKRSIMSIDNALDYFDNKKECFKIHFLNQFKARGLKEISIYQQGDFIDLCRGPHIVHTGQLKAFKLLKIAGAYWQANTDNVQLQRIYGTAFVKYEDLKSYLDLLEEAGKRDHRKLGQELKLFSFQSNAPGLVFWHPNGRLLYNVIVNFIRKKNQLQNYEEVSTPLILNQSLWQDSGHMDHFKEHMYFTEVDDRSFALKPMNCPAHCLIYKNQLRSYRELPIRFSEFGLVHRHELSGVLHGLFRARSFTQDDAHVFCMDNQLKEEIKQIVEYARFVYKVMGFEEYFVYVATKPDSVLGDDDIWMRSTKALEDALVELDLPYSIKDGEGAFYGPKIEFNIRDSLNRNWQCGTVQIDFFMPKRLKLYYTGDNGKKHVPILIHRAILGSLERFIGVLIEHYGGKFPLWLAPVQIMLLNVLDRHSDYVEKRKKYRLRL